MDPAGLVHSFSHLRDICYLFLMFLLILEAVRNKMVKEVLILFVGGVRVPVRKVLVKGVIRTVYVASWCNQAHQQFSNCAQQSSLLLCCLSSKLASSLFLIFTM